MQGDKLTRARTTGGGGLNAPANSAPIGRIGKREKFVFRKLVKIHFFSIVVVDVWCDDVMWCEVMWRDDAISKLFQDFFPLRQFFFSSGQYWGHYASSKVKLS